MTRVLVLGGGHNGLVAAISLARAGLDVTVLEAGPEVGGCLWSADVGDVHLERGAVDHGGLAAVAAELDLDRFGLDYVQRDRLLSVVFGDGQVRNFEVSARATAARLGADGPAYLGLVEQAGAFFAVLDQFPVPPTPTELAATLSHLRGGDQTFRSLLSSAEAVVERTVTDPHLRAALSLYAAHGQIPPWSGGSGMLAYLLPGAHGGPAIRPVGGARSVLAAMVAALEAAGGRVRTEAEVTAVVRAGDGFAVTLRDGDVVPADRIISTLDVRRTTALVEDAPAAMRRAAATVASGKLNVSELTVGLVGPRALLPERLQAQQGELVFVQSGLEDLRRGFGDLMAGRQPEHPWAMVARADTGAADAESVGLWISSVVPLRRADGPWTARREGAAAGRAVNAVSSVLGTDLAGAARRIVVSGPTTWASRLHGDGNPNHLDLTLDQMLGWRPPGMAGHRTPLPGLYLSGAGTHPGGGLSGASGRAAASVLLTDLTGRRVGGPGPLGRVGHEVAGLWKAFGAYLAMRRSDGTGAF